MNASSTQSQALSQIRYKREKIDGVDVFYRESGPKDGPVVLLLHGFPTSSQMFRSLIPLLSHTYRVIAPDYPGYGQSDMPDRAKFAYTFENYTNIIDKLTRKIGADKYALYVMDYGGPVGFRLAVKNPERVTAIIVQNGNAYEEGFGHPFWDAIMAYWKTGASKEREAIRWLTTLKATYWQYTNGVKDAELISPDAWTLDQALLDRPGNAEIQLDLFYDYRTNVPLYPAWHAYFTAHKPPMLIAWGTNDEIFPASGAPPYLRHLPDAEVHMLDTGHFALEDHQHKIAGLMCEFLGRVLPASKAGK